MKRYLEMTNLPFKVGQVLTVTGVPNRDGDRFSINFGHSEGDVALHVDVRFNFVKSCREVVFNSCHSGTWHKDYQLAKCFPFNYGENFKVSITFTREQFLITLPDESEYYFPNRHGSLQYNDIFFWEKVKIHGVEIIDLC
ncbi:beta-galactoside-binding lectin-like isoform X1 [Hypomesus transpacificus]|uniref:beta-galactoside-binding lectin-like isoform X1 n=1 Tax=Hypomesus transpacificus TaxID=137520 RepID=UPI001F0791D8|nr:beta-galactoside-binding lectin-like isoform X1 [Hypomesus transpacificus]